MSFQVGNTLSLCYKQLKHGDYTISPFQAFKLWEFRTDHEIPLQNYSDLKMQTYRVLYPENHKYFGNIATISSSNYERVFTTQSLDPKVLWYYLDHNFYTDYFIDKIPVEATDDNTITYLAESSSLMIIPLNMFGEGIRGTSFRVTNYNSVSSSYTYTLVDDSFGNLRDTAFDDTKFPSINNLLLYTGFNEKYREYNFVNKRTNYVMDSSPSHDYIKIVNNDLINYAPGIPTTDTSESTGVCALMEGGYFEVKNYNRFNFHKNKNFAFSFWIKIPNQQYNPTSSYNSLFNKNTMRRVDTLNESTLDYIAGSFLRKSNQYPFDIFLHNNSSPDIHKISFQQSSGIEIAEVKSSTLTPNTWYHVVCQKSGSNFQIWLNGVLDSSIQKTMEFTVQNENNFYISGNGLDNHNFSGSLDEIRIYSNALTQDQIEHLANNDYNSGYAYGTSRVGNIFYKNGIVTVSDPRPKYKNALLGQNGNFDYNGTSDGFIGSFRGSATFYQYEIICKIKKNEFNYTMNPSVRRDKDINTVFMDDYVTGSAFTPYITTIGLYSRENDLVAVAKLANAIKKRDDVDMNVIVRFDM